MTVHDADLDVIETDIAIVGMAAHLPGAGGLEQFWQNLVNGVELIQPLSRDVLRAAGESSAKMAKPNYVAAAAPLEGFDRFDADFFGFSPKEAAILDPQHRQFLEVAWEALENAGHPPENFIGAIGVFAGCGMGSYLYMNLASHQDLLDHTGMFLLRHTGNDKDFLASRVSHIFDLKGPSVNVQTACSTSLVAVHSAVQSLLSGECDMALAGGVTIELPHQRGYLYHEGEVLSPDGHCYAFDARAAGTVFGSGAGCVVLRRAKDAIRDGDHIWAIIKGSAVNNDGADKAGYLAPSVVGQADCVAVAHLMAGVDPQTISYVECHGTGTALGDPIEVAALTLAFREQTKETGFCRIGSLKPNIGHLDTAAGVASLIKVALSLHHRQLPASLHYEQPNPQIDFENSPFVVNDRLTSWQAPILRAGVNSLGVGGTNAHVVLQEAPIIPAEIIASDGYYPLVISARSTAALDAQTQALIAHLRAHPDLNMRDLTYTLKQGRRAFSQRRVVVARTPSEAADLLEGRDPHQVFDHEAVAKTQSVVFMFPGGGSHYAGMAAGLYDKSAVFTQWMDQGFALFRAEYDVDLKSLWLAEQAGDLAAGAALRQPSRQLPLIMLVEYALAQHYIALGVQPKVLIGHSMGENTAAALAGVMSFSDCLRLVALRGQLFERIEPGAMLVVGLSVGDLAPYLGADLDVACENAPEVSVVSGPVAAIEALIATLAAQGIESHRLAIETAAHSRMLDPLLAEFGTFLQNIALNPPQLPVISNRTGAPLSSEEAQSPKYWVAQLRETVLFEQGIASLDPRFPWVFIEMGPGRALSSLAKLNGVPKHRVIEALRPAPLNYADEAWALATFARAWGCGLDIDWTSIFGVGGYKKLILPSYQFERKKYFIEPYQGEKVKSSTALTKIEDPRDWGWRTDWTPCDSGVDLTDWTPSLGQNWLIFVDALGICAEVAGQLLQAGQNVVLVQLGDCFVSLPDGHYLMAPEEGRAAYDQLFKALGARGFCPDHIIHGWLLNNGKTRAGSSIAHQNIEHGFWSQTFLLQALAAQSLDHAVKLTVLSNGAQSFKDQPLLWAEKALTAGPVLVASKELPWLRTAWLDFTTEMDGERACFAKWVIEEALASSNGDTQTGQPIAIMRNQRRYQQVLRPMPLKASYDFPQGAHLMIIGGLGGIGQCLAQNLNATYGVKITIVSRSLSKMGSEIHGQDQLVLQADVTNLAEMRAAKAAAERHFGQIHTVIHAAGVLEDGPLLAKTQEQMELVLDPKVFGTQVLDQVFADADLKQLILFSSTSTQAASAGQMDYVAANEYLNAYAKSKVYGATKVIALNWGIWQNVGMAQNVVTGGQPSRPLSQPLALLKAQVPCTHDEVAFVGKIAADHWLFTGHQTRTGLKILPGTAYIELVCEAFEALSLDGIYQIADLTLLQVLALGSEAELTLRVSLQDIETGYQFKVESIALPEQEEWLCHAVGRLKKASLKPKKTLNIAEISKALGEVEVGEGLLIGQEQHMIFGQRWRLISERRFGRRQALALLETNALYPQDFSENWLVHPALLDMATGWAMDLVPGYSAKELWVPVAYRKLSFYGPMNGPIVSYVQLSPQTYDSADTAIFDIILARVTGEVVAEISGLSMRKLNGLDALRAQPRPRLRLSNAQNQFHDLLTLGIHPSEGAKALTAAIAAGRAQVFVSSVDLKELVVTSWRDSPATAPISNFERPSLSVAYQAPSTDIEQRLAQIWTQLLGVRSVGIEDNFFDLGGHSLIAVRLFAQIRQIWSVDLPISVLFEAPTIASCAQKIVQHQQSETPVEALPAPVRGVQVSDACSQVEGQFTPATAVTAEKFKYLVALHPAFHQKQIPLFMVAGMFGNVLNLRHLAQLIGKNRSFYGLQARGLYGKDAPHTSFVEAATAYLAELRQVQPHGPYALGGFSGGGLIAWEMARQLEEMGEEVMLLALLDTPLPRRPQLAWRDRVLIKLEQFRRSGLKYLSEWRKARLQWREEAIHPKFDHRVEGFHNMQIEAAFRQALTTYELSPRDGTTVLFRPHLDQHWQVSGGRYVSRAREYVSEDNGLTQYAPNLQVIEVPGNHDSMVLEPNVRVLATQLQFLLARAGSPASDLPLSQAAE